MVITTVYGMPARDLIGKKICPSIFEGPFTVTGVDEPKKRLLVATKDGTPGWIPVTDNLSLLVVR